MLTFKYQKIEGAAYISHLDCLRAINRTIRRAGISAAYSEGFNPHMNVFMSPPVPLGLESVSEYCTVDCDMPAHEFLQKYNSKSADNLKCTAAFATEKKPNLAAEIPAAGYSIKSDYLKENFGINWYNSGFTVLVNKKGIVSTREVSSLIHSFGQTEDGIDIVLGFGNGGNLRIDLFMETLKKLSGNDFKYSVIKTHAFCGGEKLVNADEFLRNLAL